MIWFDYSGKKYYFYAKFRSLKMNVTSAEFKFSSSKLSQIPRDGFPEFAFIGRSNVGKSSLINMLTGNKSLAKVSATPGKTQLINHFLINNSWYLVDLPGYGYARTSKSMRGEFSERIKNYVLKAEKMHFLFVLIDSRHTPMKIDLDFITMLGENGVPFGIVFTKSDKQSARITKLNVENYLKALRESWDELPPVFITSAEKGVGRDGILDFIGGCVETRDEDTRRDD